MSYPETIKYIQKQLDEGVSPNKIKDALSNSGYTSEVIDELMNKAGVQKPEKKAEGIEKIIFKDAAIAIVLLLVMGSFVYFSFFRDTDREFFSPIKFKEVKVSFLKISPLELERNKDYTLDLSEYVKDNKYDPSDIIWKYSNKVCINVRISGSKAILRSVFLPECPIEESIKFEATNPDGKTDSDVLIVNIV